jgi:F-type H+-transporting ATPase subunit alpha
LVELLKQPAASPFPPEREVVSIWAGTTGQLDDLEVSEVRGFEAELHEYIAHNKPEIFRNIIETGKLEDDTVKMLEEAVAEVKAQFKARAKDEATTKSEPAAAPARRSADSADGSHSADAADAK